MNRSIIVHLFSFVFYTLVQALILKNLAIFNLAFCFLYVLFLLSLPVDTNPLLLMVIAFLMGIVIDTFYDSLGLHASTMVLIAYLRNPWLALITPQSGYEVGAAPSLRYNGIQWFLVYSIPLIFLHHFVLFYVEASSFNMFLHTFFKVILSTLFTLIAILIVQFMSGSRARI
jgi:hypothetical protein